MGCCEYIPNLQWVNGDLTYTVTPAHYTFYNAPARVELQRGRLRLYIGHVEVAVENDYKDKVKWTRDTLEAAADQINAQLFSGAAGN